MSFLKRVYDNEFKLNDSDDSIIEYITIHRNDINKISIQKIANDLFISPNTIMRLSKKLGYSGFSELKFSLHNEDIPNTNQTVTSQIFDGIPVNITKTLDINDGNDIEKLVSMMTLDGKIMFVGVGDSVYFCELFGRYLRCLNRKVEYYQQIHDSEYMLNSYTSKDLIIVISASGETKRLVELAKKAKSMNVKIACMTHYGTNSLSEIADLQICFWGEKRRVNNYNVTDYIGLMMIIRIICERFWLNFSDFK